MAGEDAQNASDSEPEAPLVQLPADILADPTATGSMSDEPPEDWGAGQGNVFEPDVVSMTSQMDPVAAARASLLEDAARARAVLGGSAPTPQPATPHPVQSVNPRGNRAPDIRQALARAASLPNTTKYRSRVVIGAAWQFDGQLHLAPDWVDRNWAAWDDGPAVEIPNAGLVHKAEWLVVQNVLADDGSLAYEEIKIYPDATFRALFMPEPLNAA